MRGLFSFSFPRPNSYRSSDTIFQKGFDAKKLRLLDDRGLLEAIRGIGRGLEQARRGEGRPMRNFLKELAKERGISLK